MAQRLRLLAQLVPKRDPNENLCHGLTERPTIFLRTTDDNNHHHHHHHNNHNQKSSLILGSGSLTGIDDRSISRKGVVNLTLDEEQECVQATLLSSVSNNNSNNNNDVGGVGVGVGVGVVHINGTPWKSEWQNIISLHSGDFISLGPLQYEYKIHISKIVAADADATDADVEEDNDDNDNDNDNLVVVDNIEDNMEDDDDDNDNDNAPIDYIHDSNDDDTPMILPLEEEEDLAALRDDMISIPSSSSSPSPEQPPGEIITTSEPCTTKPTSQKTSDADYDYDAAAAAAAAPKEEEKDTDSDNDNDNDSIIPLATHTASQLAEEIQCPICLEILVHPRTCDPCGHSFCAPCLQDLDNDNCPHCRQSIHSHIPALALDNLVSKLVSVPKLLDPEDVQHYKERTENTPKVVSVCVCVCKCMYVCVCICMCMYVCMYVHQFVGKTILYLAGCFCFVLFCFVLDTYLPTYWTIISHFWLFSMVSYECIANCHPKKVRETTQARFGSRTISESTSSSSSSLSSGNNNIESTSSSSSSLSSSKRSIPTTTSNEGATRVVATTQNKHTRITHGGFRALSSSSSS